MTAAASEMGLWATTWSVAQRNITACAAYVGMMMVIGFAQDFMSSSGGLSVAQGFAAAFLAIPAHLSVLRGDKQLQTLMGTNDNRVLWRFFWRAFLLGAIAFIPAIIALILAATVFQAEVTIAIGIMALILAMAFPIVFAKWGTMLPAAVVDSDYSFATASRRSSTTFGYAFSRLLVSFLVLTALMVAVILGLAMLSAGDGKFLLPSGMPDMPMIAGAALGNIIGAFQVVMTAVILSRAYLRAEGKTAVST
jgi:hypothetical protein